MQKFKFIIAMIWWFVWGILVGGVFGIGGLGCQLIDVDAGRAMPFSIWWNVSAIFVGLLFSAPAVLLVEKSRHRNNPQMVIDDIVESSKSRFGI